MVLIGSENNSKRRFVSIAEITAVVTLLTLVLTTGCHGPRQELTIWNEVSGISVQDRPIDCQVLELTGTGNEDNLTVMIIGTIHGSEPAGEPLVHKLSEHLLLNKEMLADRRVVLIPLANPDGRAINKRHNVNGIDLNRNFPAPNFKVTGKHGRVPLSEPESRAIKAAMDKYQPDRIVSIHQPLVCIDYDGPGEGLAQAMGEWTDLPVKRLGSRPGSLGSYAGITLNVPIITVELPKSASRMDPDTLWERYGMMLLASIRYPDPLE